MAFHQSVICSHTLTSVMKSTVKASSQMHAVFLPLSVMNLSFTSPMSTFGIRVNFLEAQTYVSFLRKYDANDNVIYSICSWYCYLSSVTGDNRWGWPRLCCICQDGIGLFGFFFFFLVVFISYSSFNTEITVSRTRVAFLLLILVFQVRHETEERGEWIWKKK